MEGKIHRGLVIEAQYAVMDVRAHTALVGNSRWT